MSEKATEERIAGRELAEEVLSFVQEDATEAFRHGFWRTLLEHCPSEIRPTAAELLVMDDCKAKAFEGSQIEFGLHRGSSYGEIPISYLAWLADSAVELQSYLRSERGRRRLAEGE